MPRRRVGVLLPLEDLILEFALRRARESDPEFHGFAIASELNDQRARALTAHGTLYKVLERLERGGLLESRWEEAAAIEGGRPRRRLYRITEQTAPALQRSRSSSVSPQVAARLATS